MDRVSGRYRWALIAAVVCSGSSAVSARAGDGELFPNVAPYDETVASPIGKPERAIPKQPPATPAPIAPTPEPTPEPVPAPAPTPAPEKEPATVEPTDPPRPTKPPRRRGRPGEAVPTTTTAPAPPPPPPPVEMTPYAAGLLTPMLNAQEQQVFATEYAEEVSKALAGTVQLRRKTADLLEEAATAAPSAAMKRYLLLSAFGLYIRASTPLPERVQKAEVLLPLLIEHSLPVVQARADALNDLMLSASSTPNDRFMDLFIDAHATLAKMQVQAGFPRDAQDTLKKARDASLRFMHKSQARLDQLNETAAWCDRSTTAAALWLKFQGVLKASPNDPYTNTMMATLHLSLYGNLSNAAVFAARSDRKDLKAFAEVIKANPPESLSASPPRHAEQVLAITAALIDVAKATPVTQTFDRYSIACYAGDKIERMLLDNVIPAEKVMSARAQLQAAKEIVEKTNLRRGDDLPKWLGGSAGGTSVAGKEAPGKEAPAGRTVGTLADIFHGMPKDLIPGEMGWTNKQMAAVNGWLTKNLVGGTFNGTVLLAQLDSPVDGPGGKIYVPVIFGLPFAALNENVSITTRIEDQMPVKLAARAKNMMREQETAIKGKIISVRLHSFEAGQAYLEIVIVNQSD